MEDSSTTDDTLDALSRAPRRPAATTSAIVLQAALRRTLDDIATLADLRPSVRLCKGIYVEPPSVAFQEPDVIRRSFVACLDALLAAGCRVAIATHDEWLLEPGARARRRARRGRVRAADAARRPGRRGRELVAAGHPLRVYVPYGLQWYEYSLRRLQENPKVAGYVARDIAGRIVPGRGESA